jgi:hypothetical protein
LNQVRKSGVITKNGLTISIASVIALNIPDIIKAQNLFVADNGSGNIYEFTPDGVQSTFASGLNGPTGLAFNSAGNLFVADGSGNIYEFTPGGVRSTFASGYSYSEFFAPEGLAFDSAGDLFEADNGDGNIYEVTPGGVQSPFASGLSSAHGLAFDSAGNLFVADLSSGNVYEFTPDGVQSTFATEVYPYGLAFDSAGNLFVTTFFGDIIEITPSGIQSTFATGLSNSGPGGLDFDSLDNLFVADNGSGNIYEFTPDGAESTFALGLDHPDYMAFQPVPELAAVVTNGVFQVAVSMPSPYYSTIIQASTNLVNWVNIYTNTPPFTFTNSTAKTLRQCFYRAVLGHW